MLIIVIDPCFEARFKGCYSCDRYAEQQFSRGSGFYKNVATDVMDRMCQRTYIQTDPEMSFQGDMLNNTYPLLANETDLATRAAMEPSAFSAIYDHYFPKVYNYVRYRVQDADITDEITSQIFERVLAGIGSYRPKKAPFGAWLFAIARNAVQDHHRSLMRRRWFSLDQIAMHPSADPLPEETVERKDASTGLLRAIQQLSPREQDLIAMKFASRLENKEIAQVVGLSESNVGVILFRALRRLRKLLDDKENMHE